MKDDDKFFRNAMIAYLIGCVLCALGIGGLVYISLMILEEMRKLVA